MWISYKKEHASGLSAVAINVLVMKATLLNQRQKQTNYVITDSKIVKASKVTYPSYL